MTLVVLVSAALAACGGRKTLAPASPVDALSTPPGRDGATVSGSADAASGSVDAAMPVDAGTVSGIDTRPPNDSFDVSADLRPEGPPADAAGTDLRAVTPDAVPDGRRDFQPDPSCRYGFGGRKLLICGGGVNILTTMVANPRNPTRCPEFHVSTMPERRFGTVQEAAASLGCDLSCVYDEDAIGSIDHCGMGGGFHQFIEGASGQTQPKGTTCHKNITYYDTQLGAGWYASWDDFKKDFPCP